MEAVGRGVAEKEYVKIVGHTRRLYVVAGQTLFDITGQYQADDREFGGGDRLFSPIPSSGRASEQRRFARV